MTQQPVEFETFGCLQLPTSHPAAAGGKRGGASDTPAFRLTGHGTLPPSCSGNSVALLCSFNMYVPTFSLQLRATPDITLEVVEKVPFEGKVVALGGRVGSTWM